MEVAFPASPTLHPDSLLSNDQPWALLYLRVAREGERTSAAVQGCTQHYIRSGGCSYSPVGHRKELFVGYNPEGRRFLEQGYVVLRILHRYSHTGHRLWIQPAFRLWS